MTSMNLFPGPAVETMREFLANGQKFDFIFLDADQDVTQVKVCIEKAQPKKNHQIGLS